MRMGIKLTDNDREKLDWIKRSILQDLATHHTLEDLCKQDGISPRKLHKGFIKMYGDTPYSLLALQRQKLSIELLTTTTIPVQDIAARCGYVHTTGFIQLLKNTFNTTPEQYRAKNTVTDLGTRAARLMEDSLHLHHTSLILALIKEGYTPDAIVN
ncbi:AraC family transcriptional regulator [Paraflavitalea sp. CAU 1676]|uniref:helix-turn-helix transcriptional regulator n=1 Tax=Paraflavitalea sp. CAU 1676 TaxID=3032598 RepID=UPI0023DA97ED|nr:AraC family transcriptional regulator [Paraflavitalea sp. CAU 1676]MDF2191225.1 AraC family transcriptional regulator [Paraflavitalea sp. CAU 1676]